MCAGLPGPDLIGKHRAGLDFFGSFCISEGVLWTRQKEHKDYSNKFHLLSFACAKESNKEKHTANDLRPLAEP
jgi:hypothetical protein